MILMKTGCPKLKGILLLFFGILFVFPRQTFAQGGVINNQVNQLQLLNESTPSSQSAINFEAQASLKTLISRIKAASARLENITNRISARMEIMKQQNYRVANRDILLLNILKKDSAKLKEEIPKFIIAWENFQQNSDTKKNYPAFRKQIIVIINLLKSIDTQQKKLVGNLKLYSPPSAVPTKKPTPTRKPTPTKIPTPTKKPTVTPKI